MTRDSKGGLMPDPDGRSWSVTRLPGRAIAILTVGALLLVTTACGDDDDGGGGSDDPDETAVDNAAELLGPEDEASGEPVRIGMISDGRTDAFDNRDELRSAEATAQYWNTHRGGVAGRPIEVVTCETGNDPAGATDCGNQMVEEDVVAVALSQSAIADSVWEPIHEAGIPTYWFQTSSQGVLLDTESSFTVFNPLTSLFGLPIDVAESEGADRVAFVIIDVPQAREGVESLGPSIMGEAGLEYDVYAIPTGTADMTSQMQEVVDSGAGVVHITGNDAFCTAALNGLSTVGYDGAVAVINQCITDATREGVSSPDVLEGIQVASSAALGDTDDETYQLYQAVMGAFGDEVTDVDNFTSLGGYSTMAGLATALDGVEGDLTPEVVIEAIKSMPEQELPGGGGMTYQCGGSASAMLPAVCTNQWLRTELDAEGQPTSYEVVDSTDILPE
jgi:branched-chain amino acid transport system substrate-binding protein